VTVRFYVHPLASNVSGHRYQCARLMIQVETDDLSFICLHPGAQTVRSARQSQGYTTGQQVPGVQGSHLHAFGSGKNGAFILARGVRVHPATVASSRKNCSSASSKCHVPMMVHVRRTPMLAVLLEQPRELANIWRHEGYGTRPGFRGSVSHA